MFVELVDALRCPRPHAETWLVASADTTVARHIVAGTLGCPICHAEYPIVDGVAHFEGDGLPRRGAPVAPAPDDALKLAAFLDLAEGRGSVLLAGRWGAAAPSLAAMVTAPLLLIDPPAGVESRGAISIVLTGGHVPVAESSMRAAAVDESQSDDAVATIVAAVRAGGRVVGPASVAMPAGLREIARDETLWIGEREGRASPLITLQRG